MGVATTLAPKGLGPQNPTKNLAHIGVLLGHFLSQNHLYQTVRFSRVPNRIWTQKLALVRYDLVCGTRDKICSFKLLHTIWIHYISSV